MDAFKQFLASVSEKDLEQRKLWYSSAADAYNRFRPRYPDAVVHQVVTLAHLDHQSNILEIGCGPGTATLSFAPLLSSILALEPNPALFELAQQNCRSFPHVTFRNRAFEEWQPEGEYDAVLAASSFHWIDPTVSYAKAASVLREEGHLILLWNKELQPSYAVYQRLSSIYQTYAPWLDRYEQPETQAEIFRHLGQLVTDSGYFHPPIAGQVIAEVTYTAEEYLMLLNTYSPYLQLPPDLKTPFFEALQQHIKQECGGTLDLSFTSAFHVAPKRSGS